MFTRYSSVLKTLMDVNARLEQMSWTLDEVHRAVLQLTSRLDDIEGRLGDVQSEVGDLWESSVDEGRNLGSS